jgi:alkylated DNA repair dioxygenase AlkB
MGWHADDTTILAEGTGVGIVSLGATRTLKLRARDDSGFIYEKLKLEAGSLLLMPAEMQAYWRHAIKREGVDEPRVSLSFRQIVKWPEVPPEVPPLAGQQ